MPESNRQQPFWKTTPMHRMTREQWESLCDGCARCCLHKFPRGKQLVFTAVHCQHLDTDACRCTRYRRRRPGCVKLTPEWVQANWQMMPDTCAYRLVVQNSDLPDWHPLVSGDADSVHRAGMSVRGRTLSDAAVPEEALESYSIRWVRA